MTPMDPTLRAAPAPIRAPASQPEPEPASRAAARRTAQAFEASFLAEMLRETGINRTPAGWGGGAGEDAFGGFLTEEYARLLAARGGIGLAEHVFAAMTRGEDPDR